MKVQNAIVEHVDIQWRGILKIQIVQKTDKNLGLGIMKEKLASSKTKKALLRAAT
jgi:hypothetical protein